jgi:hypothetical protein
MTEENKKLTLLEKLFEIRRAVPYLQKKNQGQQYAYVSSSDVIESVRAKMDEMRVLLIPRVTSHTLERFTTPKGSNTYVTEIDMLFTWVDIDNPKSSLEIPWYCQGIDIGGEKGPGKAYTYGEKYFLLKFFQIATDKDDPDVVANKKKKEEEPKRKKAPAPGADTGQPLSSTQLLQKERIIKWVHEMVGGKPGEPPTKEQRERGREYCRSVTVFTDNHTGQIVPGNPLINNWKAGQFKGAYGKAKKAYDAFLREAGRVKEADALWDKKDKNPKDSVLNAPLPLPPFECSEEQLIDMDNKSSQADLPYDDSDSIAGG